MNTIIFPFLLSGLASFSTLIGYLPILLKEKYSSFILPFSLAVSSGVMFSISIFSLIPESFVYLEFPSKIFKFLLIFLFMFIGVILVSFFDIFLSNKENNPIYKLGILSTISLILHNIPEGITTYFAAITDKRLGILIALAIALHNIPEGISIAVPIYYSTQNKLKAFLITFLAGFSELFGSILTFLFLKNYITNNILSFTFAITAGIMIYLSIFELLPNSFSYKRKKVTIFGFILGFFLMLLCDFLLH